MSKAAILESNERIPGMSRRELAKHRSSGKIPANLFGTKIGSNSIFVDEQEFKKVHNASGRVFEISFEGKNHMVNAQEIQREPVSGKIIHLNFHQLTRGVTMTTELPLKMKGKAVGTKAGGVAILARDSVSVSGLPKNMPEHIDIDVTKLNIGDTLHMSELKLPKGLSIEQDASATNENDLAIATCVAPTKQEAVEEVESSDEIAVPNSDSGKATDEPKK